MDKYVEIVRDLFGEDCLISDPGEGNKVFGIKPRNSLIVLPDGKKIYYCSEKYFNDSVLLAVIYGEKLGENFGFASIYRPWEVSYLNGDVES
jgi:hypothetical protein